MARVAIASHEPESVTATLALRVAEARVEDVGRAIARLAPADLLRMGARAGDVLKITGGTSVSRAPRFQTKNTKAWSRSTAPAAVIAALGCRNK